MDYLNVKELYHHGIKGMKWGVRKAEDEVLSNSKKTGVLASVNKSVAKFETKVENKLKKTPVLGKHFKNMKEVSETEHAKRGYAILGSILATTVAITAATKIVGANKTKASYKTSIANTKMNKAFKVKNASKIANGESAVSAFVTSELGGLPKPKK